MANDRFHKPVREAVNAAVAAANLPTAVGVATLAQRAGLTYTVDLGYARFGAEGQTRVRLDRNVWWAERVTAGLITMVPHLSVDGMSGAEMAALNAALDLAPVDLGLPPVARLPVPSWAVVWADDPAWTSVAGQYVWAADAAQMVADFTAEMRRALQ